MSKKNGNSELRIASKLKAGKTFTVASEKERKSALFAAKFFGVEISTNKTATGEYEVKFIKP